MPELTYKDDDAQLWLDDPQEYVSATGALGTFGKIFSF
jgi:hypothetical protein